MTGVTDQASSNVSFPVNGVVKITERINRREFWFSLASTRIGDRLEMTRAFRNAKLASEVLVVTCST